MKIRKLPSCVVLALVLGVATDTNAAIEFGQLDQCDDMNKVATLLRSTRSVGDRCGVASNALERSLLARSNLTNSQICWLKAPPVESLRGFSCALPVVPFGGSLICVRPAKASEIVAYKANVTSFRSQVDSYLERAKQCRTFTRGTSVGARFSMSKLLTFIGKVES